MTFDLGLERLRFHLDSFRNTLGQRDGGQDLCCCAGAGSIDPALWYVYLFFSFLFPFFSRLPGKRAQLWAVMVAMVRLAPFCEPEPRPRLVLEGGDLLSLQFISTSLIHLPFPPSISPHAGYRFSSPQFLSSSHFSCLLFSLPPPSFPSHQKRPPHGLQTGPERCAERGDLQCIITG